MGHERIWHFTPRPALRGEMELRPHAILEHVYVNKQKCGSCEMCKNTRLTSKAARERRRHQTPKLAGSRHSDCDVLAFEAERRGLELPTRRHDTPSRSGSERGFRR